jgi:hypothetical protein
LYVQQGKVIFKAADRSSFFGQREGS